MNEKIIERCERNCIAFLVLSIFLGIGVALLVGFSILPTFVTIIPYLAVFALLVLTIIAFFLFRCGIPTGRTCENSTCLCVLVYAPCLIFSGIITFISAIIFSLVAVIPIANAIVAFVLGTAFFFLIFSFVALLKCMAHSLIHNER